MPLESGYISVRNTATGRTSSLRINEDGTLSVLGVLNHGDTIELKDAEEAVKLQKQINVWLIKEVEKELNRLSLFPTVQVGVSEYGKAGELELTTTFEAGFEFPEGGTYNEDIPGSLSRSPQDILEVLSSAKPGVTRSYIWSVLGK